MARTKNTSTPNTKAKPASKKAAPKDTSESKKARKTRTPKVIHEAGDEEGDDEVSAVKIE